MNQLAVDTLHFLIEMSLFAVACKLLDSGILVKFCRLMEQLTDSRASANFKLNLNYTLDGAPSGFDNSLNISELNLIY